MKHGEIWLCESPATTRPALILTRDTALGLLQGITVAGITKTPRRGPTQLNLGNEEGLRLECVANFDDISVVNRAFLTHKIGDLGARRREICAALHALADC